MSTLIQLTINNKEFYHRRLCNSGVDFEWIIS